MAKMGFVLRMQSAEWRVRRAGGSHAVKIIRNQNKQDNNKDTVTSSTQEPGKLGYSTAYILTSKIGETSSWCSRKYQMKTLMLAALANFVLREQASYEYNMMLLLGLSPPHIDDAGSS